MFTRGSFWQVCRLRRCLLCLCALALSLHARAAGTGAQGDWWMFHHDPQHTGRSAYQRAIRTVAEVEICHGKLDLGPPRPSARMGRSMSDL